MPAARLGAEGHCRVRGALSLLVGALLITLQRVCWGCCWGPEDCHHSQSRQHNRKPVKPGAGPGACRSLQ